MWEAEVVCNECRGTHAIHSELEAKPRSFVFQCPATSRKVAIRFVDPSVVTSPWSEVSDHRAGSIPVDAAEAGGSFDL